MVAAAPASFAVGQLTGNVVLRCYTAFFNAEVAERGAESAEQIVLRPAVAVGQRRLACLVFISAGAAGSPGDRARITGLFPVREKRSGQCRLPLSLHVSRSVRTRSQERETEDSCLANGSHHDTRTFEAFS